MGRISETMERHHGHCDGIFVAAEEAAAAGDWDGAGTRFGDFHRDIEAHFGAEESVLFPGFEERTGMTGGPTAIMRMEHEQMRGLIEQLEAALAAQDADRFAGLSQTLLVLMQQHNMKEENILYPMCDQALADDGLLVSNLEEALAAV